MSIPEYLRSPCGASSLPFWKTEAVSVPENMLVVRDDAFTPDLAKEYEDVRYFKLLHRMDGLEKPALREGFRLVSCETQAFAEHIRECYGGGPSAEELSACRAHPVCRPDLWIAVAEEESGRLAATGIAELDGRIGEGFLEWIQVSPAFRRLGLGAFVVKELLWRMRGAARFTTVSGRADNKTNPFALYQSCGFSDRVIWHVLTKRRDREDGLPG